MLSGKPSTRWMWHCRRTFPIRGSSVNVTKSARNYGFGHIYWKNPDWKTSFFCAMCKYHTRQSGLMYYKKSPK